MTDSGGGPRLGVAMWAAGFYRALDGATWEAANSGITAPFLPEPDPVFGQCVHKVDRHPTAPDTLFLQHHWGAPARCSGPPTPVRRGTSWPATSRRCCASRRRSCVEPGDPAPFRPVTVVVRLASALRQCAGGAATVELDLAPPVPLRAVLDGLALAHPAVGRRLRDEAGALRRHVNVFVGPDDLRTLDGLDTVVPGGAEVAVLSAVSGD